VAGPSGRAFVRTPVEERGTGLRVHASLYVYGPSCPGGVSLRPSLISNVCTAAVQGVLCVCAAFTDGSTGVVASMHSYTVLISSVCVLGPTCTSYFNEFNYEHLPQCDVVRERT
jgi:hypothetical protein